MDKWRDAPTFLFFLFNILCCIIVITVTFFFIFIVFVIFVYFFIIWFIWQFILFFYSNPVTHMLSLMECSSFLDDVHDSIIFPFTK